MATMTRIHTGRSQLFCCSFVVLAVLTIVAELATTSASSLTSSTSFINRRHLTGGIDSCAVDDDCQNRGICVLDNGPTPYCSCMPSISGGIHCEDLKCNLPCLNGGSCRHSYTFTECNGNVACSNDPNQYDTILNYVCECVSGYSGTLCEMPPPSIHQSTPVPAPPSPTSVPATDNSQGGGDDGLNNVAGNGSGVGHTGQGHAATGGGAHGGNHGPHGGGPFAAGGHGNIGIGSGHAGFGSSHHDPHNKCHHIRSKDCLNNGICVISKEGNYCQCPQGTAGVHCEETLPTSTVQEGGEDGSGGSSSGSASDSGSNNSSVTCPLDCPPGSVCQEHEYELSEGRTENTFKCEDNTHQSSSEGCSLPCQNGSSCRKEEMESSEASGDESSQLYRCECLPGYRGIQCETPFMLCPLETNDESGNRRHECWNGGICRLDTAQRTFQCDCEGTGFTGDRCQDADSSSSTSTGDAGHPNDTGSSNNDGRDPGPCTTDDQCSNGGLCVQMVNQPVDENQPLNYCQCPFGFGGLTCGRTCSLECHHGSSCRFDEDDEPFCDCGVVSNVMGSLCEIPFMACPITGDTVDVDIPAGSNVMSLHNKCIDGGACVTMTSGSGGIKSECLCPDTRTGLHCEFLIDDLIIGPPQSATSHNDSTGTVILVVVIVVVVITVVALIGVCMCRRFGENDSTSEDNRSKKASDIEMTGDGISRDSRVILEARSEDTADSNLSEDAAGETNGTWVGVEKRMSQYGTEVHASWHEMMEQAEQDEVSSKSADGVQSAGEFT